MIKKKGQKWQKWQKRPKWRDYDKFKYKICTPDIKYGSNTFSCSTILINDNIFKTFQSSVLFL